MCFDLSGVVRSDPAEDPDPSVEGGVVRECDRQAFPDDPALHLPSPEHLEKSGFGASPEEGKRGVLPGQLLCLRSGVLPGIFGKGGLGDQMQKIVTGFVYYIDIFKFIYIWKGGDEHVFMLLHAQGLCRSV